ncbi:MAG TPA: DNA-processing protein DprA [Bacteroidia bacterium]|nr:DNA-processing protein DprA [Bacteroidia bacterium]
MTEDLKYKIALSLLPGVGCKTAKKLITFYGNAEAVFKEKKHAFNKTSGRILAMESGKDAALIKAEQEMNFIVKNNIKPLFFLDKSYPSRLKQCEDSPVMLYCRGEIDFFTQKVVSIVGTRKATEYGKNICDEIIKDISGYTVMIVSGMAYGIDIAAHKAAIKNNLPTVAAMAHGLDRIYPLVHKSVAESMYENGGLVTEFLSGTNPDRENFPKRNRIIAGLSDATIVIEAGKKGGALITAGIANSYNRDVFAVPGKVGDMYSEGCNFLIKKNLAALIESAEDLIYYLGWEETGKKNIQKQLFVNLSPEEEVLMDILKEKGTMAIDNLCNVSRLSTSKVAALLLNLEFSGLVKSLPGKMFQLT